MSFIHKNAAVLFISFVVCGFGWLFGGRDADLVLKTMTWLSVFMTEVALCFPQRREGESTSHARTRTWNAMGKDPLMWTILCFIALLCIPFANYGLCPNCDAELIAQGHSAEPPFGFLPFCVDRVRHLQVVMWFVPALLSALFVKHCTTRAGKRTLLKMVVWNGVALAFVGFVQQIADAPGPLWRPFDNGVHVYFFSTFGYPNMAGCYFAILFCIAVSLWRWQVSEVHEDVEKTNRSRRFSKHRLFWMKHHMLIPSLICLFATFNTLSRAAIMLVSVSAAVLFLHAAIMMLSRMKKSDRVKAAAFCCLALIMLSVVASAFMPENITKEMGTVDARGALDRVTGRGEYHSKVAMELWQEHLVFGIGGWGYIHFCPTKMPQRTYYSAGSANVHNDHLQFLMEHGLVGYLLLVAVVCMLLSPLAHSWISLSKAARFLPSGKRLPTPQSLFALPGAAFSLLVAAAVPMIHAFGDCPLRSPAVLSVFFVSLACTGGYLPREERASESKESKRHSRHHSK